MKKIFVLFILFVLSISCNKGKHDSIIIESESLLDTDPDSALAVLRTIYPEDLNEEERNRYFLLKIQAEYKSYQDITSDSMIFSVKNYYLKKEDRANSALASYYCGCFYNESGEQEKALESYFFAQEYAEDTKDWKLKALINNAIGHILLEQLNPLQAMSYFRESAVFDRQAGNLKNEAISYIQIGDCFQYLEMPDSAMYYYEKCLALAESNDLRKERSNVRQNMGVLYANEGDPAEAIRHLKDALSDAPELEERIKIYTMLSDLYRENHSPDSASVYMNHLLQQKDSLTDLYAKTNLYHTLSGYEKSRGNYEKALDYHEVYSEQLLQIIDVNLDSKLLELEKKYNYEKLRVQNVEMKLHNTSMRISLILCIVLVLIVAYCFYEIYQSRRQKIIELNEKINQLEILSKKFDENEDTFRAYVLRHFNVLKKAASLNLYLKDNKMHKNEFWVKKINDIIYNQDVLDWDFLYDIMNKSHDNFFTKLKIKYPELKEIEFRIICLTYTDFSTEDIALILNFTVNTINIKRSAIRKKLGVEAYANINDFLNRQLKE